MPKIPLANLPAPPPDTRYRIGHVWSHDTMIPIVATRKPEGLFVRLNVGHETLGDELKDISAILSKQQVEDLCKGKEIKL